MPLTLNSSITDVDLIGPTYARRLEKLNIFTIKDLLYHFPFRYDDVSSTTDIADLSDKQVTTIHGTITSIQSLRTRTGKTMQKAIIADSSGSIEVTWFNQPFLANTFRKNPHVSLSGTVKSFRQKLTLSSPKYELIRPTKTLLHTGRVVPIYHETYGVSSKWLRSRIAPLLKQINLPEPLPQTIVHKENLLSLETALNNIHFPQNQELLDQSRYRLSFDELFYLQLAAQVRRSKWQSKKVSHQLTIDKKDFQIFIDSLPFTLTKAQQKALLEIQNDLGKPIPMNRLLQGDVGSGKTVIAAACMYIAFKNGQKSLFMAPTEVLALQHQQTLQKLLEPLGLTLSTQTRSHKDKIDNADVYIGTHALLHRKLPQNIGLVIIDEQHRFGVEQRGQLIQLPITPNLLSMTATPIPRTIALTLYADLDVSIIDEMPIGRLPVKTWVVNQKKRQDAYSWIEKEILNHKTQAFIVCPLIEDSTTPMLDEVKAATTEYEKLQKSIFPNLKLSLLHGKMSSKEKERIINEFHHKKSDILVSTPVIEVGIDIKNATIMVIESAQRFGLAQLHQLRGRVGRGDQQSYCLLFSDQHNSSSRLKHLESTRSGFKLAEIDLKLRGPGSLQGTQQSGFVDLKIANLGDSTLVNITYQCAVELLSQNPNLQGLTMLKNQLQSLLAKPIEPN